MTRKEQEIADEYRKMLMRLKGVAVKSGVVVAGSINEDELTCKVVISNDDPESPTEDVQLTSKPGLNAGVVLFPADDSIVWIGEIDGNGQWGILRCSELVKAIVTIGGSAITITDGLIQMNDGSLGGLTKTLELQAQINKLNTLVAHLVAIINGAAIPEPGNGSPSALQAALKAAISMDEVGDFSNIENTNIKQG